MRVRGPNALPFKRTRYNTRCIRLSVRVYAIGRGQFAGTGLIGGPGPIGVGRTFQ